MKKGKLLPVARSLYSQGYDASEIAEALDCSAGTVRRWRREDERDWSEARKKRRPRDAQDLMRQIEQQIEQVIQDDTLDPSTTADAVAKLDRALDNMSHRFENVDLRLSVCREIAEFANEILDEEEIPVARRLIAEFTAMLRDKTSTSGGVT